MCWWVLVTNKTSQNCCATPPIWKYSLERTQIIHHEMAVPSPSVFLRIHRSLSSSSHDLFGYVKTTFDYSVALLSPWLHFISIHPSSCNILNYLIVENYEESKVAPCLQANKLACHSFIDGGPRHKSLRSETEDLLPHASAGSMSFLFASVPLALQVSKRAM